MLNRTGIRLGRVLAIDAGTRQPVVIAREVGVGWTMVIGELVGWGAGVGASAGSPAGVGRSELARWARWPSWAAPAEGMGAVPFVDVVDRTRLSRAPSVTRVGWPPGCHGRERPRWRRRFWDVTHAVLPRGDAVAAIMAEGSVVDVAGGVMGWRMSPW